MITDDPGTPGSGKWENNIAIAFEHRPGETSYDLPSIDLNYGLGEHIQLTLQTAPVLLERSGGGPAAGLGGSELALKWRFLDQETDGVDMSMFPRVIFNPVQSSVRRGLAEEGTRFQIPVQIATKLHSWDLDIELGPLVSNVGRSEWLYGIVGGIEICRTTMLMAEFHGASRMNFSRDRLSVNIGLRYQLTEARFLIASLGHDVRSSDQPLALIGYLGLQLLY